MVDYMKEAYIEGYDDFRKALRIRLKCIGRERYTHVYFPRGHFNSLYKLVNKRSLYVDQKIPENKGFAFVVEQIAYRGAEAEHYLGYLVDRKTKVFPISATQYTATIRKSACHSCGTMIKYYDGILVCDLCKEVRELTYI